MKKRRKLFRTTLIGGYHKADVARYVQRLEEELEERDQEANERMEEIKKYQKLIEEAISEIKQLRMENGQLQKETEPVETSLQRRLRERRERYQKSE